MHELVRGDLQTLCQALRRGKSERRLGMAGPNIHLCLPQFRASVRQSSCVAQSGRPGLQSGSSVVSFAPGRQFSWWSLAFRCVCSVASVRQARRSVAVAVQFQLQFQFQSVCFACSHLSSLVVRIQLDSVARLLNRTSQARQNSRDR